MPDLLEKATGSDCDEIYTLYCQAAEAGRKTGRSDWGGGYPGPEFIQKDLEAGGLLVLREAGKIIAAVSLMEEDDLNSFPVPWTAGKSCALARLCIAADRQGTGLGSIVETLFTQRAAAGGYETIRLLASVTNQAALRLYEKQGYRRTGQVHAYGLDFYCYEKVLMKTR